MKESSFLDKIYQETRTQIKETIKKVIGNKKRWNIFKCEYIGDKIICISIAVNDIHDLII